MLRDDHQTTRKRFDIWSRRYDRWRSRVFFGIIQRRVTGALAVGPGDAVLDVGCGTGNLVLRLAGLNQQARIVGVDLSPEMISAARAKTGAAGNPVFEVAPAESLPFGDESFDLVLNTLSFHHWSDPDRGLAECRRVLKASGRLAVVDITGDSHLAGLYGLFGPTPRIVPRGHYPKKTFLSDSLKEAGMENVTQSRILPSVWMTSGLKPNA